MTDLKRRCSFCDGLGTTGVPNDIVICQHCSGTGIEVFANIDLSGIENNVASILSATQSISDICKTALEVCEKNLAITEEITEICKKILEIVGKG